MLSSSSSCERLTEYRIPIGILNLCKNRHVYLKNQQTKKRCLQKHLFYIEMSGFEILFLYARYGRSMPTDQHAIQTVIQLFSPY